MKFKVFAVFLLVILCFTFIVPFASAETVNEGGAQYIFHELHASFIHSNSAPNSYYLDLDSGYFNAEFRNMSNFNEFSFIPLSNVTYEFSMNNSPFAVFSGDYAAFTPVTFTGGKVAFNPDQDSFFDGRLHSFAMIFGVPITFPYDVQDNYLTFTNVDFWDDSSLTKLNVTVGSPVDGRVSIELSGSSHPTTTSGSVPTFSLLSQFSILASNVSIFNTFEFYVLTWYHTPTFFNMFFNVTPTSMSDAFFMLSLIDMVSVNTGYETGYREGIEVGKQQANNTVNTESASYTAGYDTGFEEGIDHANNRLNSGSVSYQVGYDTGYDEGLDYANTHVNESSASYIQGKYDGVESANKYTFLGLISAIIDAPIRAVFGYTSVENGVEIQHGGLLTFEVFGVDMSNFVLSIFSIAVVLCIIRVIRGG